MWRNENQKEHGKNLGGSYVRNLTSKKKKLVFIFEVMSGWGAPFFLSWFLVSKNKMLATL